MLDLAVVVALGGDCLADVALVRAQPELFGRPVASDPTVSRLVQALAEDPHAIGAIRRARAAARAKAWQHRSPVSSTDRW